jgi:Flp pilus assembly pilin Flp
MHDSDKGEEQDDAEDDAQREADEVQVVSRHAQNAVEYGIIVAGVAIVVLLGVTYFGSTLEAWFSSLVRIVTSGR